MNQLKHDEIRQAVRDRYGRVAEQASCGCGSGCCTPASADSGQQSVQLGYSPADLGAVPERANLGLGCGNPQAIAALKPGEVVLDLGSGAGFDGFLAAHQVGEQGHVIGVDMTPEMVSKARANAVKSGLKNVEFRLGEIENLPVADTTVDAIISNCVINLSPDKPRVFAETYRVLKPGGRLAISDIVAVADLPDAAKQELALHTGCIAGASTAPELIRMLEQCGFVDIRVLPKDESRTFIRNWVPGSDISEYVLSASIEAIKPEN